jgi:phage tail-like protein
MDANGTRFHLLLGRADWVACTPQPSWDDERAEVTLEPLVFRFPAGAADRPPALADRRGADRDRFGNWYWIDRDATGIRVLSVGGGSVTAFWPGAPGEEPPASGGGFVDAEPPAACAPLPLAGLAVTADHYLVAGVVEPAGLLVFDLRAGGPPRRAIWSAEVAFRPWDIAARPGGGAFVLDRTNARLWELDRELLVVSRGPQPPADAGDPFVPADGGERLPAAPARVHARVTDADAVALAAADAIAVEAAADGSVLVLDRPAAGASLVRRYVDGVQQGAAAQLADDEAGVSVVAHDLALVGDAAYVVDAGGNQAYRFDLGLRAGELTATLRRRYYPLRVFGGKALVGTTDGPFYDFGDGWIPLVEQSRPRYAESASFDTPVLDGREPGCVWHRVLLDACVPPDAAVDVWSRAADEQADLANAEWRLEPRPRERRNGSEQPWADALPPGYATHELLLQAATGRWAQLRLVLSGDGRVSPRLRALRVTYSRFSYLDAYLPKVYREDEQSASFLDRFLANLEGIETGIEDRIASAQVLVDPRTTPPDALDWLARWFDVALDPAWSEERRRVFLRHAVEFFGLRGTSRGLELALRLAFDTCSGDEVFAGDEAARAARIVESFRSRRVPPVVLGDPTAESGLRTVAAAGTWSPAQGSDVLDERWRTALAASGATVTGAERLPLAEPAQAGAWRALVQDALGFVPAIASAGAAFWQAFLRRRYGRVEALDDAYGLAGSGRYGDFGAAAVPVELPRDGAPLRDWWQFETVVLPMRRTAHRFTVLLPVSLGEGDSADEALRRALAQRIVDLQKPAHTVYDVRFFWSAFRVGEARLGEDTIVALGSRSPRLLDDAVLGRDHLGESRLGGDPPPVLLDRPSVGRDRLNP